MPLKIYHTIEPEGEIGIWNILESEDYFLSKLDLTKVEFEYFSKIKGRRRTEWLAVRYLLHFMSGRETRGAIIKDEYGKPHLKNSEWHISISHSQNKAAVIASPKLVGIDIQNFVPRIDRIAHKFMSPIELSSLSENFHLEHLHIYWGAKEALYKAYGKKELEFKEHLRLAPFEFFDQKGKTSGRVKKGDYYKEFEVHFDKVDSYYLVWVAEKNSKTK